MTATEIVGILNVTPDSFSDGGRWSDADAAIAHGLGMVAAGASIVDVGGESTRPGADPVDPAAEEARVVPVIAALAGQGVTVSVDTRHASTASAAIEAGARIVNDVSGGLSDPRMAELLARSGVRCIAMHWRGGADVEPVYADVVAEVRAELKARVAELVVAGVDPDRIAVDPGLGFAKTAEHNWRLLAGLDELVGLGHPVLVGASRKRFLGELLPADAPVEDRDLPTAVVSALAARAGAWAVRVHDVRSTAVALGVLERWRGMAR
jgi:dihydropteroate synthase